MDFMKKKEAMMMDESKEPNSTGDSGEVEKVITEAIGKLDDALFELSKAKDPAAEKFKAALDSLKQVIANEEDSEMEEPEKKKGMPLSIEVGITKAKPVL